mmetsp:Transcript_3623/g.8069  ORF Transcript_3623/g.8069 Transcript_3623/m.8069 type:complete len:190 (-) Transcript_3623:2017-2586(-)
MSSFLRAVLVLVPGKAALNGDLVGPTVTFNVVSPGVRTCSRQRCCHEKLLPNSRVQSSPVPENRPSGTLEHAGNKSKDLYRVPMALGNQFNRYRQVSLPFISNFDPVRSKPTIVQDHCQGHRSLRRQTGFIPELLPEETDRLEEAGCCSPLRIAPCCSQHTTKREACPKAPCTTRSPIESELGPLLTTR